MSDIELNDIELKELDPYHDYIEQKARDAEFESVSLEQNAIKQRELDDDYIYHIMGPIYFLTN
jgi:hypothetical protein